MAEHLSGAEYLASIFGTEKDKVNCSFYIKIGACRHGDKCSRIHNKPTFSQSVLLKNLYHNPKLCNQKAETGLSRFQIASASDSSGLSMSDSQEQAHFDEFFEEIFTEVEDRYGEIEEMNVCDNIGEHMIGNVYIKFRKEEDAERCEKDTNDRWFGGEPIYAELSPVTDFREACCQLTSSDIKTSYIRRKGMIEWSCFRECMRGGFCNFMHLKPISYELRRELYNRDHPWRDVHVKRRRKRAKKQMLKRANKNRKSSTNIKSATNNTKKSSFNLNNNNNNNTNNPRATEKRPSIASSAAACLSSATIGFNAANHSSSNPSNKNFPTSSLLTSATSNNHKDYANRYEHGDLPQDCKHHHPAAQQPQQLSEIRNKNGLAKAAARSYGGGDGTRELDPLLAANLTRWKRKITAARRLRSDQQKPRSRSKNPLEEQAGSSNNKWSTVAAGGSHGVDLIEDDDDQSNNDNNNDGGRGRSTGSNCPSAVTGGSSSPSTSTSTSTSSSSSSSGSDIKGTPMAYRIHSFSCSDDYSSATDTDDPPNTTTNTHPHHGDSPNLSSLRRIRRISTTTGTTGRQQQSSLFEREDEEDNSVKCGEVKGGKEDSVKGRLGPDSSLLDGGGDHHRHQIVRNGKRFRLAHRHQNRNRHDGRKAGLTDFKGSDSNESADDDDDDDNSSKSNSSHGLPAAFRLHYSSPSSYSSTPPQPTAGSLSDNCDGTNENEDGQNNNINKPPNFPTSSSSLRNEAAAFEITNCHRISRWEPSSSSATSSLANILNNRSGISTNGKGLVDYDDDDDDDDDDADDKDAADVTEISTSNNWDDPECRRIMLNRWKQKVHFMDICRTPTVRKG